MHILYMQIQEIYVFMYIPNVFWLSVCVRNINFVYLYTGTMLRSMNNKYTDHPLVHKLRHIHITLTFIRTKLLQQMNDFTQAINQVYVSIKLYKAFPYDFHTCACMHTYIYLYVYIYYAAPS